MSVEDAQRNARFYLETRVRRWYALHPRLVQVRNVIDSRRVELHRKFHYVLVLDGWRRGRRRVRNVLVALGQLPASVLNSDIAQLLPSLVALNGSALFPVTADVNPLSTVSRR